MAAAWAPYILSACIHACPRLGEELCVGNWVDLCVQLHVLTVHAWYAHVHLLQKIIVYYCMFLFLIACKPFIGGVDQYALIGPQK